MPFIHVPDPISRLYVNSRNQLIAETEWAQYRVQLRTGRTPRLRRIRSTASTKVEVAQLRKQG